jgi:hypothetical protein
MFEGNWGFVSFWRKVCARHKCDSLLKLAHMVCNIKEDAVLLGDEAMTINVAFNEQEQIIEVKVDESFNWAVIEKLAPQIAKFYVEKGCHSVLMDLRAAAGITLSTVQIYMTPEKMASEFSKHGGDILKLRRALLLQKNDQNFHFLETVIINKFQTFRIFFDEAEARAWLKE